MTRIIWAEIQFLFSLEDNDFISGTNPLHIIILALLYIGFHIVLCNIKGMFASYFI